jgi:hypothetical protein
MSVNIYCDDSSVRLGKTRGGNVEVVDASESPVKWWGAQLSKDMAASVSKALVSNRNYFAQHLLSHKMYDAATRAVERGVHLTWHAEGMPERTLVIIPLFRAGAIEKKVLACQLLSQGLKTPTLIFRAILDVTEHNAIADMYRCGKIEFSGNAVVDTNNNAEVANEA